MSLSNQFRFFVVALFFRRFPYRARLERESTHTTETFRSFVLLNKNYCSVEFPPPTHFLRQFILFSELASFGGIFTFIRETINYLHFRPDDSSFVAVVKCWIWSVCVTNHLQLRKTNERDSFGDIRLFVLVGKQWVRVETCYQFWLREELRRVHRRCVDGRCLEATWTTPWTGCWIDRRQLVSTKWRTFAPLPS